MKSNPGAVKKRADRKKAIKRQEIFAAKPDNPLSGVKKSHFIRFFLNLQPFCYGQTSPLGVPLYAFGFSLSVLHAFLGAPK